MEVGEPAAGDPPLGVHVGAPDVDDRSCRARGCRTGNGPIGTSAQVGATASAACAAPTRQAAAATADRHQKDPSHLPTPPQDVTNATRRRYHRRRRLNPASEGRSTGRRGPPSTPRSRPCQLLDPGQAVAERVHVDVQLRRRPLPAASGGEEPVERSDELRTGGGRRAPRAAGAARAGTPPGHPRPGARAGASASPPGDGSPSRRRGAGGRTGTRGGPRRSRYEGPLRPAARPPTPMARPAGRAAPPRGRRAPAPAVPLDDRDDLARLHRGDRRDSGLRQPPSPPYQGRRRDRRPRTRSPPAAGPRRARTSRGWPPPPAAAPARP